MKKFLSLFCLALCFWSCDPQNNPEDKIDIVCTTGMIGDMVQMLVGDSLKVHTLMGPGVDPHIYKPSQGDIQILTNADVIVYNGLHLEGKMNEIFEKLRKQKTIIVASEGLNEQDLINSTDFVGAQDPHIWFDVQLWKRVSESVAAQLKQRYPHLRKNIDLNALTYGVNLLALDQYCQSQMASIPEDQRIMITAHDAFKYFGRAYNLEVRGLQGISTTAEFGLKDISQLVQFVSDKKIKALFVESSVPQKSIEAVIEGCQKRGHNVILGGELFSDAMGAAGSPEGTYVGMVKHNVETIVKALK